MRPVVAFSGCIDKVTGKPAWVMGGVDRCTVCTVARPSRALGRRRMGRTVPWAVGPQKDPWVWASDCTCAWLMHTLPTHGLSGFCWEQNIYAKKICKAQAADDFALSLGCLCRIFDMFGRSLCVFCQKKAPQGYFTRPSVVCFKFCVCRH